MGFTFMPLKELLLHFISTEDERASSTISGDRLKQRVW